jgi:DNA-binding NarL/FixJ family response regulator
VTIRVLLADDQALVRAGFRMIIDAQPDMRVVGEAADGVRAVEQARATAPDLVLMDIRMPTMDGIEATRRLTGPSRPAASARVVILTTYDLDEYVFDALTAGASGFLLKDVTPEDLVRAVRVTAEGHALLAPAVTRRLIEEFTAARPDAAAATGLARLTAREVDVLRQLACGRSNAEIGAELFLSESTVKTHVHHILDKLALRDRVQAVIYAYDAGLVRRGRAHAGRESHTPQSRG